MTDITELAQRNELLIANGQQTADLLRHLADNEIDSDYFAVVSECESYGKETDAELSITEFALRAAGYVDALVEALEYYKSREERVTSLVRDNSKSWDELYRQVEAKGKRNVELVEALESEKRICATWRKTAEANSEKLEKAQQRNAELESRLNSADKLQDSAFRSGLQHGFSLGQTDDQKGYEQSMAAYSPAAGIKVEAE